MTKQEIKLFTGVLERLSYLLDKKTDLFFKERPFLLKKEATFVELSPEDMKSSLQVDREQTKVCEMLNTLFSRVEYRVEKAPVQIDLVLDIEHSK
jgi:hypothetical protein